MQISKERILEIFKAKGIDVREIAKNPVVYEKACNMAYKAIPIPWRWLVGRKRAKKLVDTAINKI